MRVSGIATARAVDEHAIFFADSDATRFAGHTSMIDSIGVFGKPGISAATLQKRVAKIAGDTVVLKGADRGVAEFPEAARDRSNLIVLAGVFGGMACSVTLFVVASTLTLAAQHRQRELALLRTIGTTPRQLRRMIFAEAAVVGILATAVSLLPAGFFGRWLFDRLAGHGLVPDVVTYYQGWVPRLTGIGAALLVTLAAALVAARRAGRAKPVEALVESGIQRHWLGPFRLLGALLFLGGGGALAGVTLGVMHGPIAASTAGPSVICWAIGLALIGPGVTKVVFGLLYGPVRLLTGMGGRLALQNARARAVPMAAAVMPLMLASGLATANLYMQTTQMHVAEQAYTHNVRADAVLSAGDGMPNGVLPQVRKLPGATAAAAYVGSAGVIDQPHLNQDDSGWPLQGVTGSTASHVLAVPVRDGRLADLRGNTVALPTSLAHKLHRTVGGTITMRLGDRTAVPLRIVALYSAKRGYETIMLPVELLAAHTTNGLPEQILVRGDNVLGGLSTVASHWPGVHVADRKVLIKHYQADQQTQAWVNYLMVGMIVAYTVIAVANTLIAGTGRRRREFGLARLTGATRGQIMRMMSVEGGLVAVAGILLGTVIALLTLLPFCVALGDGARPYGPLWIYLVVMGSAAVLAMGSTLLPGRLALRSRPAEAASVVE
jgi:putative ABC transport system permease protein